jgi:hypothetical protein
MSEEKQVAERTSEAEIDFLGELFFYTIEEVAKEDLVKLYLTSYIRFKTSLFSLSLTSPISMGPICANIHDCNTTADHSL